MIDKTNQVVTCIRTMQYMRAMGRIMQPADVYELTQQLLSQMREAAENIESEWEKHDRAESCSVWNVTRNSYHAAAWAILKKYEGIAALMTLRPSVIAWEGGPSVGEIDLLLNEIGLEARANGEGKLTPPVQHRVDAGNQTSARTTDDRLAILYKTTPESAGWKAPTIAQLLDVEESTVRHCPCWIANRKRTKGMKRERPSKRET